MEMRRPLQIDACLSVILLASLALFFVFFFLLPPSLLLAHFWLPPASHEFYVAQEKGT